MAQTANIIEHIEEKNQFIRLCYFKPEQYQHMDPEQDWKPLQRLLVDSDQKHLIYVMEVEEAWQYIRFPLHLWKQIDDVLVKEQDLMLVLSKTDTGAVHKSIPIKGFHKECMELIGNMRQNANYGEEMIDIVEEYFQGTFRQEEEQ